MLTKASQESANTLPLDRATPPLMPEMPSEPPVNATSLLATMRSTSAKPSVMMAR